MTACITETPRNTQLAVNITELNKNQFVIHMLKKDAALSSDTQGNSNGNWL